jgi:serine/threonine protein kinase
MSPEILADCAHHYCKNKNVQLGRELGRGAFKCAYLLELGDDKVALKVAEMIGSASERLVREAVALQSCSHSGIAQLRSAEAFTHEGKHFWIVLEEFLPGETLEKQIAQGVLPAAEILRLGSRLADVLEHLNQRKLVHRDIKPANILFRQDGTTPVLTDFGIVRMLDSPSLTQDFLAQGPGTPFYAAPEQLNNDKHLIDWRTDQFGLAVTLSHCAIGHHPFQREGSSERDAILAVARREKLPAESEDLLKALGLSALCRAMQPWPVERFRKPQDFILALKSE